jgi:hypothetical protein
MSVRCQIVLAVANQVLAAEEEVVVSRRSLLNYVVCSESVFAAELLCLQRIRCSLSNYGVCSEFDVIIELCCLKRISFRNQFVLSAANSMFAIE